MSQLVYHEITGSRGGAARIAPLGSAKAATAGNLVGETPVTPTPARAFFISFSFCQMEPGFQQRSLTVTFLTRGDQQAQF